MFILFALAAARVARSAFGAYCRKTTLLPFWRKLIAMPVSTRLFAVSAAFIFALASPALAASCYVEDKDIAQTYVGPCVNGKAQGHGKAYGRDTYEGDFVAGRQHGKGVYVWGPGSKTPGDRYEGDWRDGHRTGKGVKVWADGSRYEGDYQDGVRTGKGVWTRGNAPCPKLKADQFCPARSEGKFENGDLVSGKITFVDGDTYTGDFMRESDGTLKMQHATARGRGGDVNPGKVFENLLGATAGVVNQRLGGGAHLSSGGAHLFECKADCKGTVLWIPGKVDTTVRANSAHEASKMVEDDLKRRCEDYPYNFDGTGRASRGVVHCDIR
jgi:hypothetical protein